MNTPEDYIMDALEIVATWNLPDEEAYFKAVNDQARLMAGGIDHYEYTQSGFTDNPFQNH